MGALFSCVGCGQSELCTMFSSEWRADSQAIAADGMYWRSVYGGARLVLGCIRLTPFNFAVLRLFMTLCVGLICFSEVVRMPIEGGTWMLPFHHWVLVLELFYFLMASLLTVVAVCTAGNGGIARSTPFYVRLTELAYGALYPATLISAASLFAVTYLNASHCVSAADTSNQEELSVLGGLGLLVFLVDAGFCRQPYYASFHAIVGLLFCWGWLLFSAIYELVGGTDQYGHSYIYRCLDWSYPIIGGRYNAEGKLLYLNVFIFVPLVNYLYWLLLWARRRTLTIYKKAEAALESRPLTQPPRPPTGGRRVLFEYASDYRDLALDGRHWRAQFGGSSSPKAAKMGAYICCDAVSYPMFRLVVAAIVTMLFGLRVLEAQMEWAEPWKAFLYFELWVLAVAVVYFVLAWVLTAFATCTEGAESSGTPMIVWLCWAAYGALLPAALVNGAIFVFVTDRTSITQVFNPTGNEINRVTDMVSAFGLVVLVLLDAWINRQPYYATFHSFVGLLLCWGYLAFNAAYVLLGYTNEANHTYIYLALSWRAPSLARALTPGMVTLVELFVAIPLLNTLYWCMLWARRRARVAVKQSAV